MRTVLVLLVLAFAPAIALAQYAPPPPPPAGPGYYAAPPAQPPGIQRRGFIIGFSLGGGSFNCDTCSDEDALSGLGLDIHLGGMLSPTLALMFDGWGVGHPLEGGGNVIHVIDTIALQTWMTPQLWIKGGIGIGQLSLNDEDGDTVARSETGFAVMGALGYELFQGTSFALDVQGRLGTVRYEDEVSVHMGTVTVGVNWY